MKKIRDGRSQKREDAGARKGREVAKHFVFPMVCGSGFGTVYLPGGTAWFSGSKKKILGRVFFWMNPSPCWSGLVLRAYDPDNRGLPAVVYEWVAWEKLQTRKPVQKAFWILAESIFQPKEALKASFKTKLSKPWHPSCDLWHRFRRYHAHHMGRAFRSGSFHPGWRGSLPLPAQQVSWGTGRWTWGDSSR